MLKKFEIEDVDRTNPMALFYEFGFTPEDIKSSILDSFNEYFSSKENLEKYAINHLVSTWILYLSIKRDRPETLGYVKNILRIFNDAKNKNVIKTFEAYSIWAPEISQAISKFWYLHNSQNVFEELKLEDFSEETLRIIGLTIEGISKPFLKLLFHLSRIKRDKNVDWERINDLKLGTIIDELINSEELSELFIISPFGLRLNQWRNIAYHHNSKVLNGKIYCWYKKGGERIQFEISREELHSTLTQIKDVYTLIRIVECIFCADNDEINEYAIDVRDDLNIRSETELLDFYTPITSQGFKILDLQTSPELAILKVQDMMEYPDLQMRGIHSSQFLYNLWLYSSSNEMRVEYFTYGGEIYLKSEIWSKSFTSNKISGKKFSEIMKDVNFSYVAVDMSQDEDPFLDMKLPKTLNQVKDQFYSQKGELISLDEFIKSFTLSVFTNYLVFRSEEFDEKNIVVNIGSDGSLTIGEDERGSFILQVPAIIKSKELQGFIINILDSTIDRYEKKKLKVSIVDEAKNQNRYLFKKSAIKDQMNQSQRSNQ